ncbi:chorismate--pyruvate lyase family protein [Marinospirillum insulare]|nr:chorismate lyase [Marinospirillum insulare]
MTLTSLKQQPNETASINWLPAAHLTGAPAGAWRSWLQEKGSLTLRLKSHAQQDFKVSVLSEKVILAPANEVALLGCIKQRAWVREVLLEVDGEPWVFARSVLPLNTQGGLRRRLTQVGNTALGQVLFSDPLIKRGPFVFCAPNQLSTPSLWGRASCFYAKNLRLLVAEHFLHPMAKQLALSGAQ